jgi:hypothetical protein
MKQPMTLALLAGFAAGSGGAATYLLLGGAYYDTIPLWARILFYPGFLAGYWTFERSNFAETRAKLVGVIVVGIVYALLGIMVRWTWMRLRHSATGGKSNLRNSDRRLQSNSRSQSSLERDSPHQGRCQRENAATHEN